CPDVADVAAVRGDDERRAAGERGDQPGRNEEVRVDDVRPRGAARPPQQLEVAALAARARVEHRELDVVAAVAQRELDLADERPEVGRTRPRVQLRDEQDPHVTPWARSAAPTRSRATAPPRARAAPARRS